MRIPVDLEKIIDVTDEIYTFSEVMDRIELRNIEKLCKTDIRYIWLLDEEKAPSFVTFSSFLREYVGKI